MGKLVQYHIGNGRTRFIKSFIVCKKNFKFVLVTLTHFLSIPLGLLNLALAHEKKGEKELP